MPQVRITEIPASKIERIKEAGRKEFSPEEYEELLSLLSDLQIYGLTPWINVRLGTLMSRIEFELEIAPLPEWSEALQACDFAFLGIELKSMCIENDLSSHGHKKLLCERLYNAGVDEVVEVMEPYLSSTMFFNIPEARKQLTTTGFVYTLRPKKRRTGRDVAYYGSFYKKEKIGDVWVEFIKEIRDTKELEVYVGHSGFRSLRDWLAAARSSRFLFKVSLR